MLLITKEIQKQRKIKIFTEGYMCGYWRTSEHRGLHVYACADI